MLFRAFRFPIDSKNRFSRISSYAFREFSTGNSLTILGIETSCDDTSCAVLTNLESCSERKGMTLTSNIVMSQNELFEKYGGIYPNLAAREHEIMLPLAAKEALAQGLSPKYQNFDSIDCIAVCAGPGLSLCLNQGMKFAKDIVRTQRKKGKETKFIAVHHIEAHILVARLENPGLHFPFLALVISGGHTSLVLVKNVGNYKVLAETSDDAIGEAFDKVWRMIIDANEEMIIGKGYASVLDKFQGMVYGQALELCSSDGEHLREKYPLPIPLKKRVGNALNSESKFTYSGLKAATKRLVDKELYSQPVEPDEAYEIMAGISASFQYSATEHLLDRLENFLDSNNVCHGETVKELVLCGGVASNSYIRSKISDFGKLKSLNIVLPSKELCRDNAGMIAWAGFEKLKLGHDNTLNVDYNDRWSLS